MIEVKKRPEKVTRTQKSPEQVHNYKMVNIRVSKEEHAWLDARAMEISEATGYAPSISGVLRLLMQEAIREKRFKVKAV